MIARRWYIWYCDGCDEERDWEESAPCECNMRLCRRCHDEHEREGCP